MIKFRLYLVKETSKISVRIRTSFLHRDIKQYYRVGREFHIEADDEYGGGQDKFHDSDIQPCHRQISDGRIITPFNINIKLKESAESWRQKLKAGDKRYTKLLQGELDKIFKNDAKKAALITDQKCYDETPERYMLAALLTSYELCDYYNVYPLLGYSTRQSRSDYKSKIKSLARTLSIHSDYDFYTTNNHKVLVGMSNIDEEYKEELDDFRSNDFYAAWGVIGKTNPCAC